MTEGKRTRDMDLKVGDRITCVVDATNYFEVGRTYDVKDYSGSGYNWISVDFSSVSLFVRKGKRKVTDIRSFLKSIA